MALFCGNTHSFEKKVPVNVIKIDGKSSLDTKIILCGPQKMKPSSIACFPAASDFSLL